MVSRPFLTRNMQRDLSDQVLQIPCQSLFASASNHSPKWIETLKKKKKRKPKDLDVSQKKVKSNTISVEANSIISNKKRILRTRRWGEREGCKRRAILIRSLTRILFRRRRHCVFARNGKCFDNYWNIYLSKPFEIGF